MRGDATLSWTCDMEQCMGCGNCLDACPKHLLSLSAAGEVNVRGVRHITITDAGACVRCGRCELMCTAGAIRIQERGGAELLDRAHIPPHAGCHLGSLAKACADAVWRLGIAERVVLFKKAAADVSLAVETHDFPGEEYYDEALSYKRSHPDRVVIVVCSSSKEPSTRRNNERLLALGDECVTVLETLDWFEAPLDEAGDLGGVERGGNHVMEQLAEQGRAAFLVRETARGPAHVKRLSSYIARALRAQMDGAGYSVIEMVFPCFYRLMGRPQTIMPAEQVRHVNAWFDENVVGDYPLGVLWEKVSE